MANFYKCPECGEHLDWSESVRHRCDVKTHDVVNARLAKPEQKEEKASADYVSAFCAELRRKYAVGEKR